MTWPRIARELHGIPQRDAAERIGIGVVALSHLENGRNPPSDATARAMAKLYGLSVDQLFDPDLDQPTQVLAVHLGIKAKKKRKPRV